MGKKSQQQSKSRKPRKSSSPPPAAGPAAAGLSDAAEACAHYTRGSNELSRILARVRSDATASCEHCRDEPVGKKGKQQKKKGAVGAKGKAKVEKKPATGVVWACLDCGQCFCAGEVKDKEPYGHARRHSKQERHPWAVQVSDPRVCWCYVCNVLIPSEVLDSMVGEVEDKSEDVEDVRPVKKKEIEYVVSQSPETLEGHSIRGLKNLGNTCFFNSVMQNLFAMNILREYFARTDRPLGPMTMALRKLFVETSGSVGFKGIISPKELFGCICAKAPQFKGCQQQDSHELLRLLLDGLSTEETKARKVYTEQNKDSLNPAVTFVDAIFGGQTSSSVSCVECGHTSTVHEPFLDLSLPVPSKKISPKIPPTLPKKSKPPPLRERGRSRRFQEKVVGKRTSANEDHKLANTSSGAECIESSATVSAPEQSVAAVVEEESSQRDCSAPDMIADGTDSVPQTSKIPNIAPKVDDSSWLDFIGPDDDDLVSEANGISVTGQTCQNEITLQCASISQVEDCSKEPMVLSDSREESSYRDVVPSSCTQGSGVILLPYKEVNHTAKEISEILSCSQNTGVLPLADATVVESCLNTTSIADCEQADAEFDVFGGLFNEPEITSENKAVEATWQEMDRAYSESNQEEVDNTNAPISVDRCLALFTKPELLSDEHAWYCERCTARSNPSGALHSQVDGGNIGNEDALQELEVERTSSTEFKVGGSGKAASNSVKSGSHAVEVRSAEVNIYQNSSPNSVEPSGGKRDTNEEVGNEENKLLVPTCSEQAPCTINLKDEGSQFQEIALSEDNREGGSCSVSNSDKDQCGEQALTCVPDHRKTILLSSCEEDAVGEVNNMEKKGSQSSAKVHPSDDSRGTEKKSEIRMVKRNATKRILINKAPLILTVHLKRFAQDARGRFSKLSGHVSFQETLDLRPHMDPRCEDKEKCCYRLVGVVEHSGTMTGGHYVAYVRSDKSRGKSEEKHTWFCASDAHVHQSSLSAVLESEAYILFYERV